MQKQPIHKNLSTSFVNLAALVRHLHGLQFVGSVHVELSSYEADIFFTPENRLRAREFDHIAGRIADGEKALQRILVRAKEPFGRIHVYKGVPVVEENDTEGVFVDGVISADARRMADGLTDKPALLDRRIVLEKSIETEWRVLIMLASEILKAVDDSLDEANLHFPQAFRNVCDEISSKYFFFNRRRGTFVYENGNIKMGDIVNTEMFVSGLFAALDQIFGRLRKCPQFAAAQTSALRRVKQLLIDRRSLYSKYAILPHVERLVEC